MEVESAALSLGISQLKAEQRKAIDAFVSGEDVFRKQGLHKYLSVEAQNIDSLLIPVIGVSESLASTIFLVKKLQDSIQMAL